MSNCRIHEVKNNEKLYCRHLKKWSRSLTRGSNYRDLTRKKFGVLKRWLLMGSGRLREVVADGGLTVASVSLVVALLQYAKALVVPFAVVFGIA